MVVNGFRLPDLDVGDAYVMENYEAQLDLINKKCLSLIFRENGVLSL